MVSRRMRRRMGLAAEPYEQGRAGRLMRTAEALTATGAALASSPGAAGWFRPWLVDFCWRVRPAPASPSSKPGPRRPGTLATPLSPKGPGWKPGRPDRRMLLRRATYCAIRRSYCAKRVVLCDTCRTLR